MSLIIMNKSLTLSLKLFVTTSILVGLFAALVTPSAVAKWGDKGSSSGVGTGGGTGGTCEKQMQQSSC
jgi:hypothetical protein